MERNEKNEIMVLSHEPWAGYKKAFWVIFTIGCLYLGAILLTSLPKVLH